MDVCFVAAGAAVFRIDTGSLTIGPVKQRAPALSSSLKQCPHSGASVHQ
jgi:hypothetical protein